MTALLKKIYDRSWTVEHPIIHVTMAHQMHINLKFLKHTCVYVSQVYSSHKIMKEKTKNYNFHDILFQNALMPNLVQRLNAHG